MSGPIEQVTRAPGAGVSGDQLPIEARDPGAFTYFEDRQIVLTGNGIATPTDAMRRAMELDAEQDADMEPFAASHDAHVFAAQRNLQQYNPHLKDLGAEQPVPEGQQFYAQAGAELKALLAPFKNNLGALRQLVAESGSAMGGKSRTTGHGVYSQGLGLPVGNEPESVAGANSGIKPVKGS